MSKYPKAVDPGKVGTYEASSYAGGGYVWDAVLEYRVWCHPHDVADDLYDGEDYYYTFECYEDAQEFSVSSVGAEGPLALILQREYIDEPEPGKYLHIESERITEWPPEFLTRPQRNENTIPNFMAPDAPENKIDIIRGAVKG